MITGNVRVIWAHYPDIQKSADLTGTTGVGHEAIMVNSYRPLRPFDGDIASEQYAPLRAKVEQGKIIVLLHGSELYMYGAFGTTPLKREGEGVLAERGSLRQALESRGRFPRSGEQTAWTHRVYSAQTSTAPPGDCRGREPSASIVTRRDAIGVCGVGGPSA